VKTILVYDTETTGLPVWSKPSEDPCQPHITQLAAELCNADTGETLAYMNFLIKPEGWTIPDEVAQLTGITTEKAMAYGLPIREVLPQFLSLWEKATLHRVAHNESFDMRMVRIEIMRDLIYKDLMKSNQIGPDTSFADVWKAAPAFCTCTNSAPIVKLPPTAKMVAAGRTNHKPPNLTEAYRHFTGLELKGAHNAAVDIMACKAIYLALNDYVVQV
jgi:DNA polymerase III subunit epsilon